MIKKDCTSFVRRHQAYVKKWGGKIIDQLSHRFENHDENKLSPDEKPFYDLWTSHSLTDEQRRAVHEHHNRTSRHHPEGFKKGVNGMNLIDILEMVVDWMAWADAQGMWVGVDHLAQKFGIEPQLAAVILNTVHDLELFLPDEKHDYHKWSYRRRLYYEGSDFAK